MYKGYSILFFSVLLFLQGSGQLFQQYKPFSRQDSLRGSVTPERAWWNVLKYAITVEPDFNSKTIRGINMITCKAVDDGKRMQIDMQVPMEIVSVNNGNQRLAFNRSGNLYYIDFPEMITRETVFTLSVIFRGTPREALNPPWDGGWIWKKDSRGNPWMSVACQGLGASVWYPCKDYQGDEPDSASISIIVPDSLVGVGNGRLRSTVQNKNHTTTYTWAVVNPINSYDIVPYIGKYVSWGEVYPGEKGNLDMNYWVLAGNEQKAHKQFVQAPMMMKCLEYWFGPYPFYEDGYKLVESPHLGMEHQSAVAYGNRFENGYLGHDLSGTGWGKKWDFIILHESAHEWFGNSITSKDIADMWIHEAFASYGETLYTECRWGREAGDDYGEGLRKQIKNDSTIIGPYGVNKEGSADMYYKGSNLLHTIRQIVNDDEKFRSILRGLNESFYHQTVTTLQVEHYISEKAGMDLSKLFDQYLRTTLIPTLEYKYSNGSLSFRWSHCVAGFNMPVKVTTDKVLWIYPQEQWKSVPSGHPVKSIDRNFYINSRKM